MEVAHSCVVSKFRWCGCNMDTPSDWVWVLVRGMWHSTKDMPDQRCQQPAVDWISAVDTAIQFAYSGVQVLFVVCDVAVTGESWWQGR